MQVFQNLLTASGVSSGAYNVMDQYDHIIRVQKGDFPQIRRAWGEGTTNKDYFGQRVIHVHVPESVVPQLHDDLCDVLRDEIKWNPRSPKRPHRINPIPSIRQATDFSDYPRMIYSIGSESDEATGVGVYEIHSCAAAGYPTKGSKRSIEITVEAADEETVTKLREPAKDVLDKLVLGYALVYRDIFVWDAIFDGG